MKIVIFEGCDKVGKTTHLKDVREKTNYEYVLFDRFTGSAIVYDEIYNRKKKDYGEVEEMMQSSDNIKVLLVVFTADLDSIYDRLDKHNEDTSKEQVKIARKLFLKYYENTKFKNKMLIDTTDRNVDECTKKILDKVDSL